MAPPAPPPPAQPTGSVPPIAKSPSAKPATSNFNSVDLLLDLQPTLRPFQLLTKIGKYRVLNKIGEGATSDVFLCRDDFQNRTVAIKRVKPLGARDLPNGANSFAAEAALVGRLQHPNVVKLLDAVDDPVAPYLVMEYVAGSTLRPHCRSDQLLPLDQVVELAFKCAMALSYVYRQGLIHRDVKPANLLTVLDSKGEITDIKISDFGSVLNLASDVTQVHRVGSLAYMSPEQLDGTTLDCRADMYSLAAVMYNLIAGRPPFEGQVQSAMMHQVFHVKPTALTTLRSGLSPAVDDFIQRALSKSPDDRHGNWEQFAQSLSQLISKQQVPRGQIGGMLDSERFNLLRKLDFFSKFGDVELWEVVHRAKWQRFTLGHALYSKGEEGRTFHIIAQGDVEVIRDGKTVAQLGAGTSVGEMVYLAPSPELGRHSTDVIVTKNVTTISFTPETLAQVNPTCRHLFDEAFIRVLVRRLHSAHEALAHPRRIL